MMRYVLFAIALTLSAAVSAVAQDRPRVIAVNHALQVFADRLLGDSAEVVFPVPAEVDPSFWRPSISDISMIQSADMILLNGAGFATWVDRVSLPRSRLVNTTAAIKDRFIVTESITHSHGDGGEHSHEGLASYTWLDPVLATAQAEAIASAILARDLAPAEAVAERLTALKADLEALDAQAKTLLSVAQGVPLIASHPRYQYLARRYDLTMTSLEWDAGAAPTADELDSLKALVANTGAKVLLWEAEPPASAFDAVAELGLESVVFPPLARVPSSDAFFVSLKSSLTALADALSE